MRGKTASPAAKSSPSPSPRAPPTTTPPAPSSTSGHDVITGDPLTIVIPFLDPQTVARLATASQATLGLCWATVAIAPERSMTKGGIAANCKWARRHRTPDGYPELLVLGGVDDKRHCVATALCLDVAVSANNNNNNSSSSSSNALNGQPEPLADGWTALHSMRVARRLFGAAKLPDGRLLAIGGLGLSRNTLRSVEVYDPSGLLYMAPSSSAASEAPSSSSSSSSWNGVAPMATARAAFGTAVHGHRVFALGGASLSYVGSSKTVEVYDSIKDEWKAGPAMSTARAGLGGAMLPGGVLVAVGGYGRGGRHLDSVEALDLDSSGSSGTSSGGQWRALAPMPLQRSHHATAVLDDGRLYVIGGWGPGGEAYTSVLSFDLREGKWSDAPAELPAARRSLGAAVLGRELYVVGGLMTRVAPVYTDEVLAYSPRMNRWRTVAALPGGGRSNLVVATVG